MGEDLQRLLKPIAHEAPLFRRLFLHFQNFWLGVFFYAARSACHIALGRRDVDGIIENHVRNQLQAEFAPKIAALRARIESDLQMMVKAEIERRVDFRLKVEPVDSIVRQRFDCVLAPQIEPLVSGLLAETRDNLESVLHAGIAKFVHSRFENEAIIEMIRAELINKLDGLSLDDLEKLTIQIAERRVPLPRKIKHKNFSDVLMAVNVSSDIERSKVLMVGPAGSGKTMIAEEVAATLSLPFYFNGPIQSEFKLTGYKDAMGRYHRTPFRDAFENGGVYLFDELDACSPQVLVSFNTALSNKICDFPDGLVKQHSNFVCLAAANTTGTGADVVYAGRERQDGATLDRFVIIEITYDQQLEFALARNDDWVRYVQRARGLMSTIEPRNIISMRASIEGARLLAKGADRLKVEHWVLWRGKLSAKKIEEVKQQLARP